jgi:Zn-dependent protease
MKSSYNLFKVSGIQVKVHITLLILFLLPVMDISYSDNLSEGLAMAAYSFAFFIALFGSVLIHELSHSAIALRNKIKVKEITLWPLGGMASIGMIKGAGKEFRISIAGPLMSIGIGLALFAVLSMSLGSDAVLDKLISGEFQEASFINFIVLTAYLNLVLGMFNLFLPIFPMDGGRVLRSVLEMWMGRLKATKIAIMIGHGFLAALVYYAILIGSLWIIFIAAFLFIASLSELKMTQISVLAEKIDLKKLIRTNFIIISPDLNVKDFLKLVVPWQSIYPVLDSDEKLVGVVDLEKIAKKKGKVNSVMDANPPTLDLQNQDECLVTLFTNGYGLVVRNGKLDGVVTLHHLKKALQIEAMKSQKN